jgi:hypothetical protein
MPFTPYARSSMLNFALLGAPVTRPTSLLLGLATATPTSSDLRECSDPGYLRQAISFPEVSVTDGTAAARNDARISWGPFSNSATIYGYQLFDEAGNCWGVGSLQAVVLVAPGQTTGMLSAALPITLE